MINKICPLSYKHESGHYCWNSCLHFMPAGVRRVVRTRIPGSNRNGGEPLYSTVKRVLSQRPQCWRIFLHVPALSTRNGNVLKPDFFSAAMLFRFWKLPIYLGVFLWQFWHVFSCQKWRIIHPANRLSGYCENQIIPVHQVKHRFLHVYPSISVWENWISSIFASICKAAASFSQGRCFSSKIARKGRIYCSPA